MPLETRDRDPYWAARNHLTSQDLEDLRNQAMQTVNDRITDATRAMTPAAEAVRKAAQESGEAARQFKTEVQAEIDKGINTVNYRIHGQGPEAPRSSNRVAHWAEATVGRVWAIQHRARCAGAHNQRIVACCQGHRAAQVQSVRLGCDPSRGRTCRAPGWGPDTHRERMG